MAVVAEGETRRSGGFLLGMRPPSSSAFTWKPPGKLRPARGTSDATAPCGSI